MTHINGLLRLSREEYDLLEVTLRASSELLKTYHIDRKATGGVSHSRLSLLAAWCRDAKPATARNLLASLGQCDLHHLRFAVSHYLTVLEALQEQRCSDEAGHQDQHRWQTMTRLRLIDLWLQAVLRAPQPPLLPQQST